MQVNFASVGYVNLIAAIICAKWAMDLGFSQFRQLLWAIAGFVAAPLILLILYVRLIRKGLAQQSTGEFQSDVASGESSSRLRCRRRSEVEQQLAGAGCRTIRYGSFFTTWTSVSCCLLRQDPYRSPGRRNAGSFAEPHVRLAVTSGASLIALCERTIL